MAHSASDCLKLRRSTPDRRIRPLQRLPRCLHCRCHIPSAQARPAALHMLQCWRPGERSGNTGRASKRTPPLSLSTPKDAWGAIRPLAPHLQRQPAQQWRHHRRGRRRLPSHHQAPVAIVQPLRLAPVQQPSTHLPRAMSHSYRRGPPRLPARVTQVARKSLHPTRGRRRKLRTLSSNARACWMVSRQRPTDCNRFTGAAAARRSHYA